jgi:hypothetical protein
MEPMTPNEFARRMKEIDPGERGSHELAHIHADCLMCDLLRSLGYKEGVYIFENMELWYS